MTLICKLVSNAEGPVKINPLKIDPTRSTMLRQALMAEMNKRFRSLRGAINKLIIEEDAFGLLADARQERGAQTAIATPAAPTTHVIPMDAIFNSASPIVTNTRWRFATDDKKMDGYREWLKDQVDKGVLEVSKDNLKTPWLEPFISSAYKKGVVRAYADTKAKQATAKGEAMDFVEGGKAEFLKQAFAGPVGQSKVKMLATRSFAQLQGVTAQMDQEMSRVLAGGLARGAGPRDLARELNKTVSGLEKKRALAIARTEVIHAHNEGQLDSFEAMNVEGVGVEAEWSTAHDGLVCPLCQPLEGVVLSIKEARGLLPRHPNCRCAWIPAGIGEEDGGTTKTQWAGDEQGLMAPGTAPTGKKTGQTWSGSVIDAALLDSVKAENPKLPAAAARAASRWGGADLMGVSKKLKPGSAPFLEAKAAAKSAKQAALAESKAEAEKVLAEQTAIASAKLKAQLAAEKEAADKLAAEQAAAAIAKASQDAAALPETAESLKKRREALVAWMEGEIKDPAMLVTGTKAENLKYSDEFIAAARAALPEGSGGPLLKSQLAKMLLVRPEFGGFIDSDFEPIVVGVPAKLSRQGLNKLLYQKGHRFEAFSVEDREKWLKALDLDTQVFQFDSLKAQADIITSKKSLLAEFQDETIDLLAKALVRDTALKAAAGGAVPKSVASVFKPAPPGQHRAEYEITENTVARIAQAKGLGVAMAVDRSDIEDTNALVWEEEASTGKRVTKLEFKTTRSGSDSVLKGLQAGAATNGWKITKSNDFEYEESLIVDGAVVRQGGKKVSLKVATQVWKVDVGDGVIVTFVPYTSGDELEKGSALRGLMSIEVPEGASVASVKKAYAAAGALGLNTAPPSASYEEALYLHRGVYLNNKHMDPSYQAIWNGSAPDDQKVASMKQWIKVNMGIDPDAVEGYDPYGVSAQSNGGGARRWERWDTGGRLALIDKMKGHSIFMATGDLYDSPDGAIATTLAKILDSGGQFGSTTNRIRVGIPIGAGACEESDIEMGGAGHAYTRIKKDTANESGFFFSIEELNRQDALSFEAYEKGHLKSRLGGRASTTAELKRCATNKMNETLLKGGVQLEKLDFIRVHDEAERDAVLLVFSSRGIKTLSDGRKVTDIVVVTNQAPKMKHADAQKTAGAAAHSAKIKAGITKKFFANPELGLVDDDYTNPANPQLLAKSGLDKVLFSKGWHTTTITAAQQKALMEADDLQAQKDLLTAIMVKPAPAPSEFDLKLDKIMNDPTTQKLAKLSLPKKATDDEVWEKQMKVALSLEDFGGLDNSESSDDYKNKAKQLSKKGLEKVLVAKGVSFEKLSASVKGKLLEETDLSSQMMTIYGLKPDAADELAAIMADADAPAALAPYPIKLPPTIKVPGEGELTKVADLPGSTKPYSAKDKAGNMWVVKDVDISGIDPDHLRNEGVTDDIYRVVGVDTTEGKVIETPHGPRKITKFIDGPELNVWRRGKSDDEIEAMNKEIGKGFVMDALLGNRDVIGSTGNNIIIDKKGRPVRIDNGGSMKFRAQGEAKKFGPQVSDLKHMRDPKLNPTSAAVFAHLTDDDIQNQIAEVLRHRASILAAIPDEDTRQTMAARLDDLKSQLRVPAPTIKVVGKRRAEYSVTQEAVERVKETKSNGRNIAIDRDDIEDNNVLVWQDITGPQKTPTTRIQFKVTAKGSAVVENRLGVGVKVSKDDISVYEDQAEQLVKELNDAILSGEKVPTSLKLKSDQFAESLLSGIGAVSGKNSKHIMSEFGKISASMDMLKKGLKQSPIEYKRLNTRKVVEVPAGAGRKLTVTKVENTIRLKSSKFQKGAIVDRNLVPLGKRGDTIELEAPAYSVDAGEGVQVKFIPRTETRQDKTKGLALQGQVIIDVPGEVSEATMKKALVIAESLGLNTKPTTPAQEEALYLHRSIYLRNKHEDAAYKKIWESGVLTDEQKVVAIKEWSKKVLKIDPEASPNYDPHGVTKHEDGGGFRHWERWDTGSKKELVAAMKGVSLHYATGDLYDSPRGCVANTLAGVLDSGGEFTCTLGRVRKGVPLTSGGTSYADIESGGAAHTFLRLKPDTANENGIFFHIGELNRQDAVSYEDDKYGRISDYKERGSTVEDYKKFVKVRDNETILKEGISWNRIDFIRVRDDAEKLEVLKVFLERGIKTLPDGRRVVDIVCKANEVPRARMVVT